jgi:hypothetical protein
VAFETPPLEAVRAGRFTALLLRRAGPRATDLVR